MGNKREAIFGWIILFGIPMIPIWLMVLWINPISDFMKLIVVVGAVIFYCILTVLWWIMIGVMSSSN